MDKFKETAIFVDSEEITINQKVALLQLIVDNIEIDTPSELSRILTKRGEKISRQGILKSNRFRKILIGKQKFVIAGVSESNLPF